MSNHQNRNISDLGNLPPLWPEELLGSIRDQIKLSDYKVVILDDDPTGTQTVEDLPVLTSWSVQELSKELNREYPAFFILTNSRSLTGTQACKLAKEIGTNLLAASQLTNTRIVTISRSDSTLRGHFPAEVDAMAEVLGKAKLPYLILPFFLEGGRFTIDDIHYVQEGENLVPAAQTVFAKDSAFGFTKSELKQWVEEKTGGGIKASQVHSISLQDIRAGGPAKVAALLQNVPAGSACIANFADYRDMQVFVAALLEVERQGKEFLYRTAASFVRTRTGLDHRSPLLRRNELINEGESGGVFIIGSYVEKTSSQLKALLETTDISGLEMEVSAILNPATRPQEIARITAECKAALEAGQDCAIYTSRKLITGNSAENSLRIGQLVSDSLVEVIKNLDHHPRYLVAKGGITSSDVATKGLGVKRAMVLGQPLPGVPAWKLGAEAKFPGMSYIVFPGNVGDEDSLVQLKLKLEKRA